MHLKLKKQGTFLEKFPPYKTSKSGDKISDFWVFKIGFQVVILKYLLNHFTKIVHWPHYGKKIEDTDAKEIRGLKPSFSKLP